MAPNQIVCMAIFMLGLFTLFVVLPWNAVYQRKIKQGQPLLPQWPTAVTRLDVIDLLITLFVYFSVQVLGVSLVVENPDPNDLPRQFLQLAPFNSSTGLSTLLTLFITIPLIYLRRRDLRAMRIRVDRFPELVRIGFFAALLLVPLTMVINALVSIFVTPYSHPVIETLMAEATLSTLIYTIITVVIAAPLVEEFVFRGVLLGYLNRVFSGNWAGETALYCRNDAQPLSTTRGTDLLQVHGANLLTSILFAALHLGQGAAYIPLFVLSFGIGYVSNKTGSIIPCVIVHMVLNGISTIPLIFMIVYQS